MVKYGLEMGEKSSANMNFRSLNYMNLDNSQGKNWPEAELTYNITINFRKTGGLQVRALHASAMRFRIEFSGLNYRKQSLIHSFAFYARVPFDFEGVYLLPAKHPEQQEFLRCDNRREFHPIR